MPNEEKTKASKKSSKLFTKIKRDNENGARLGIIEELFNDFYLRRRQVYWFNFVRGLFFGFGSVLGGTLLVAVAVWVLGQFVHWPGVGDFFQQLTEALRRTGR